jgi:hypothetical protein
MRLNFKSVPFLLLFDPILPGCVGGGNDIGIFERSLSASIVRTWRSKGDPSDGCGIRAMQNAAQKRPK